MIDVLTTKNGLIGSMMTVKEFEVQYALGLITFKRKYELAQDVNTDKGILEILGGDENSSILLTVADNPNTPIKVLEKLSGTRLYVTDGNPYWGIRDSVAGNPSTPTDILEKLSADAESMVRMGVAGNPNTPIKVLIRLSKDKSYKVREVIADNPNVPLDVLRNDDNYIVSDDAEERRNCAK